MHVISGKLDAQLARNALAWRIYCVFVLSREGVKAIILWLLWRWNTTFLGGWILLFYRSYPGRSSPDVTKCLLDTAKYFQLISSPSWRDPLIAIGYLRKTLPMKIVTNILAPIQCKNPLTSLHILFSNAYTTLSHCLISPA